MCQPGFDLSAQLRSDSCTSNCRLGNLSALAAAGQLSCNFQLLCHDPSQLQAASSGANLSARLQSVSTAT